MKSVSRGFLPSHKLEETAGFTALELVLIKERQLLFLEFFEKIVPGNVLKRVFFAITGEINAK